jgi:hypothetical protein
MKYNPTLSNSINRLRSATKKAFGRGSSLTSASRKDSDLKLYQELDSTEFDIIGRVYGQEALLTYIKSMEARRLKNGNTQST